MNRRRGLTVAICATALLMACDTKPVGKDGYSFGQETFTRTEFPIEVVLLKSERELSAAFAARNIRGVPPESVAAFAVIRRNDPRCTIYMVDPKINYQPEWVGHELIHCIYGEWHK